MFRDQVSIGYLLSAEFAQLAVQRTGQDDPTFIDTLRNKDDLPVSQPKEQARILPQDHQSRTVPC